MTAIAPDRQSAPVRRVVLTGFMGSGKSTVGPLLAARLGWRFIDADDVIVADAGIPIAEFFARHGEPAFREREHATIARLAHEHYLVLALGGGAIETEPTRHLLLNSPGTLLVHLDVKLETTLHRTAHISIPADDITPNQGVDAIVQAMESRLPASDGRIPPHS